jgi:hypothetical protein
MRIVLLNSAVLAPALARAGHAVLSVGSMGTGFDIVLNHPLHCTRLEELLAARSFVPDALAQVDDGNLPLVTGLEELPYPLVFYSIDTFCNPWHVPFAHAFDHTWVAQKDFLSLFTGEGHAAEWVPLFCRHIEPARSPEEWLAARDVPVAFVGTPNPKNIPGRLPFLRAFRALHPLVLRQGDFVPVFARTRIALNQTAAGEVNYRCFESMGCGAAMLTDSAEHGLFDLFRPGREILPPYARFQAGSAAEAVRSWLSRPHELAVLALAGAEETRRGHTDDARAEALARLCAGLLDERAHLARLADLPRRKFFLSTAYGILAAELPPRLSEHRAFFAQFARANYDAGRE